MQTVKIIYTKKAAERLDKIEDTFEAEKVNVLSCGVLEIYFKQDTGSSLIAGIEKEKRIGIPFKQIVSYEII